MYKCFITCQSEKKCTWNLSKILRIFTFFINFLIKTMKIIIYCQIAPLDHLCQTSMSGFSAFVLNLSQSDNILFRKLSNGNRQLSIIVIGIKDNLLVHELCEWLSDGSCWATCIMQMQHIMPNILHWNKFMEKANQ